MQKLKTRLKREDGFTLVEMLIVVAIIAILIAVSIPLISNALDRAKHATDSANERAAKAEILICYLSDVAIDGSDDDSKKVTAGKDYFYDAAKGQLADADTGITAYGKHEDHDIIKVKVDANGVVTVDWKTNTKGLCSENELTHS